MARSRPEPKDAGAPWGWIVGLSALGIVGGGVAYGVGLMRGVAVRRAVTLRDLEETFPPQPGPETDGNPS